MLRTVKLLGVLLLRKPKLSYCDVLKARRTIHNIGMSDVPRITITDIRKTLRQKGFSVEDGCTSITTKCTVCSSVDGNTQNKIYVNKTTGYFLCPKCNVHGDWNMLERLLKKTKWDVSIKEIIEKQQNEAMEFQNEWKNILKNTTSISKLNELELKELLKLFEYPNILESVAALSDVRVNDDRTVLYYPLINSADKIVGYRKVQAGREDVVEHHGLHSAGLFRCRVGRSAKYEQAVLVPSIQDLLNLAAHKVPGTLIWLSNCALPPAMLPVLENYSKLCLWGDWSNMRCVAEKLGDTRCRFVKFIVAMNHSTLESANTTLAKDEEIYNRLINLVLRPTDGLVTASEAAEAGLSLKTLVSEAKPAAHRSITTFAALRDDILSELTNVDKAKGIKWKRFPSLTKLLGGHRRGELTVLTGPTGCGKTTLCAELSLDLAQQGVNTLWGSFEIRNFRLARTMLQQFAGVPLEQNLQDFHKYADDFQKLPIYYLAFHGQQPIKVVMEAVEHARYMHDIAHVIVDNVQFMLGMADEKEGLDRYWKQDAVIAAFRTFATARHCHVTLVMHPRKERDSEDLSTSSIFGTAKASQEADNVLIIQDKRLTAVRGKKYLQVAKNRYSGDLGIVPLDFDKDALSYQAKRKTKPKDTDIEKTEDTLNETDPDFGSRISNDINFTKESNKGNGDNYLSDMLYQNR